MDELLDILSESGYGAMIGDNYCGAPMYADDLALIAESPEDLQAMLDLVSNYARRWRYSFNAQKSAIMVFGEAPRARAAARNSRQWTLNGTVIQEANEYHHLGVLRTVNPSSFPRTLERCTSGRSAFLHLMELACALVVSIQSRYIDFTKLFVYPSPSTVLNYGPSPRQSC